MTGCAVSVCDRPVVLVCVIDQCCQCVWQTSSVSVWQASAVCVWQTSPISVCDRLCCQCVTDCAVSVCDRPVPSWPNSPTWSMPVLKIRPVVSEPWGALLMRENSVSVCLLVGGACLVCVCMHARMSVCVRLPAGLAFAFCFPYLWHSCRMHC